MKYFYKEWETITDDKFVLNSIKGYKIPLRDSHTFYSHNFENCYNPKNEKQMNDLSIAIQELESKGAIVKCTELEDQFLSPFFLVDKPNGSHRFILNLKRFNKFVVKEHFKIEDLKTAVQLIFPNDFLASIDLEDAYFLIPVHESSRKFLRFKFNGTLYEFVCLPFGLCTAPFVFTKIMKVVVRFLRKKGFSSVIYLDDFLCIENSFKKCSQNVNQTIKLLETLGFIINYLKSELYPSNQCKFLGLIINTVKYIIELPDEKREKIAALIEKFIKTENCTILEFAQLIGKLVSCCPAIEYAWLYTKLLEKEKLFQLIINGYDYNSSMNVSETVKRELFWWKQNIKNSSHAIKTGTFAMTIYTDASRTGWGASNGIKKVFGFWSPLELKFHINYLELFAIKLALDSLASEVSNCQILLRVDNTTALSYINKMGGVRLGTFGKLARCIWQWAESRKIILLAAYIPSAENIVADKLSRIKNVDIEWELNDLYFSKIIQSFGWPSIDLFASSLNSKCKNYVSWKPDANAMYIDAFTLEWSQFYFYAFPPFALILKALAKIKREKAQGIIVVPNWTNQPWFPLFKNMIVGEPLYFEANENLLLSPCRSLIHPQSKHLSLIVSRVSGRPF